MDSSNVEDIITCGICLETFNGDSRCPRILICGHTFCHSCLKKYIEQTRCCPTCQKGLQFEKIELIPINFSLKSLLNIKADIISSTVASARALDVQDREASCLETSAAKRQRTQAKTYLSEGHCDEHNIYVGMRCMDCRVWICAMCGILKHKHCRTLVVEEAYMELKNKLSQRVETELIKKKDSFARLVENLRILNVERRCLSMEIEQRVQKLEYCNKHVRELESLKSDKRNFCQKLEQLHRRTRSSAVGHELSNAINELEKLLDEQKPKISHDQLENWCSTEFVYAIEDRFDGTKYGKVTVKDGRILVHNFQTEKPEGILIPFKDLRSKFDAYSELPNTAFLRLTPTVEVAEGFPIIGKTDDFDILIQTDGTSPRARNFLLLCSALKESSYKGKFLDVAVYFNVNPRSTCYKLHLGPAPVVEGIKKKVPLVAVKKGGVYGMFKDNSTFFISLSDCPQNPNREFGTVVAGFEHLAEQKWRVVISDCGLVI